jgi:hypothetical protein
VLDGSGQRGSADRREPLKEGQGCKDLCVKMLFLGGKTGEPVRRFKPWPSSSPHRSRPLSPVAMLI